MSISCPTLEVLLELGFEDRPPQTQVSPEVSWIVPEALRSPSVGVCYRFEHVDVVARPVMKSIGRFVVELSGVRSTSRQLSFVEGEIPHDLGSALEAAAWISFVLKSDRSDLAPLPDWFIEGERNWNLIPFMREAEERKRAYEASPKCSIDRDYARPLRRNLIMEMSSLNDEAEMTFAFDGRVLNIQFSGREYSYEVLASGERWPSSYSVAVTRESKLPARFMYGQVEVIVMEGYLRIDGLKLGPCEEVE